MTLSDPVTATETAAANPTPSGRKRPVHIPWREIASRLAEGAKPAAVAADLGLQEERIWRHLRKSLRFRYYLRQAMERQRLLAGLQLATLGQTALLSRGLQPESLDGDLLRLLDEAAQRQEPGSDLAQQIEQLGKTGERPPNMAFRRRMAEEKRRMDLQVEAWRRQDAVRAAAATAPASPEADVPERPETNTSEPVRSATNTNEPLRSATNASEPVRSATNASEAPRTAANPPEPQPALRLRWTRPPKPRQPAQALPAGRDGVPDS
jgi:hypothetical protein